MLRLATISLLALNLSGVPFLRAARPSPTTAEIDSQVWAAVRASVVAGDIVAMGRTYHPAAVLVSTTGTKPIATTLADWGKDMVTAKKDGVRATVELRFDTRQDDATTAFEVGAFKYTTTDRAGKQTPSYRRMEALLVKTNGRWQIMMERQFDAITEAAWDQLPH